MFCSVPLAQWRQRAEGTSAPQRAQSKWWWCPLQLQDTWRCPTHTALTLTEANRTAGSFAQICEVISEKESTIRSHWVTIIASEGMCFRWTQKRTLHLSTVLLMHHAVEWGFQEKQHFQFYCCPEIWWEQNVCIGCVAEGWCQKQEHSGCTVYFTT